MSDQYKAVDLFCGAGGASLGIENAGFEVVAAVDQNETALETHNENLPSPVVQHDLSDVDASILPDTEIDYLHGSPPCKGFSTANDTRHESDPRNALVFDFIGWVEKIQPKVVSMENVTGMLSITTEFMDLVESAFRDAGYRVKYTTLNAADYGVPQTRKRVYTIAIREDLPAPERWFPRPTHSKSQTTTLSGRTLEAWVPVKEAIGDLPRLGRVKQTKTQGKTSNANWKACDQPSGTVTGSGNNVIHHTDPELDDWTETYDYSIASQETQEDTPSNTIAGKATSIPYHYNHRPSDSGEDNIRRLTVREAARIQSFPDWYVFTGSSTKQYLQVGNAVPPLLQEHVAGHLKNILDSHKD